MRFHRTLTAALLALVLAGCAGSDGDDRDQVGPGPSPTAAPIVYKPIDPADAGRVKAHMPEERLRQIFKVNPVLEQRPTTAFPGGCVYYRLPDQPLANVYKFCFDKVGVSQLLTDYSPYQPPPPEGASMRRAALIAKGDTDCAAEYGKLKGITDDVASALSKFGRSASPANREAAATQIGRFVRNLRDTEEPLSAYVAPPDDEEVLTMYLETLRSQIDVLTDAREAFLAGDMAEYDRLGKEFTALGDEGKRQARDYGFAECSASTFG